ncbi:MAG: HDOD domain-containing protein [Proteobacteria bacterium]|nr:HDOD domain-containing protein [Pseudomonadota bacterium]
MKKRRSELIKQHIDSFPVLPVTVARLIQVTSSPECSVKDIVDTIHSDHSLCLTVLKIANSVLFGRPQKVDSIKMAVVILGFNEVQRIALAKALLNSFSKLAKQHKPFADRFWEHSFVTGMAARVIAQDQRITPEIGFMGGLIHDIGKLIMFETFADDYALERWTTALSNEKTLHEELQMFSFTHDMLGGQLLRKWLFPENLITAVAYHHRPGDAATEKAFAHVIQLADILSFYCCNQESLGDQHILTAVHTSLPDLQNAWRNLGLSLDDDAIAGWFHWLVTNREQCSNLREAFSA